MLGPQAKAQRQMCERLVDSEQNLQTKWWHPFTPTMRDMSNWMGKKRKLTFIWMLESLESSYIPPVNPVQHGGQIESLWDRNNGRCGCRAQHSTLSVECVQSQGGKNAVFTRWVDGRWQQQNVSCMPLARLVLYTRWKQNRTDGTAYCHWAEK